MIWFRALRRRRLLREPIPAHWNVWVQRYRPDLEDLSYQRRQEVLRRAYVVFHEKYWEGCGGFRINEEHRVAISLQIGRIAACFPDEYFEEVKSVLVYPDVYVAPDQQPLGGGIVLHQESSRSGEAWYRGPVVIAWAELVRMVNDPWLPRNVVIHEFAHFLDMRNGRDPDGIPPLESAEQVRRWVTVMQAARRELVALCRDGMPTIIDCYGAGDDSEFFAVVSEVYFQAPQRLQQQWPKVYRTLDEYYRAH